MNYIRRLSGKVHLIYTLKEPIQNLLKTNEFIDLDPIKVFLNFS